MWQLWDNNTALLDYSAAVRLALATVSCPALDIVLQKKKTPNPPNQEPGSVARRARYQLDMFYEERLEN